MKQKLFLTLALLMTVCSFGRAQSKQAYAVLSEDEKTLTFCYDDLSSTITTGTVYELPNVSLPDWTSDGKLTIEKVVFTDAFEDARPVSTYCWFYNQSNLTTIEGIENLNTSKVENMMKMFQNCSKLKSLDLSEFVTSKVVDMSSMFKGCQSLQKLILGKNFKTTHVVGMYSMFEGCSSLPMLNLTNFETGNVDNMAFMFDGCSSLKRIYVGDGWNTDNVPQYNKIFIGCTSLEGEKGTKQNDVHVDKLYAHIDGGESNPGYLSGRPSGYVVFDGDSLTFYNDGRMEEKTGTPYLLNIGTEEPEWLEHSSGIFKVVFDKSFATARPISFYNWFSGFSILAEIKGLQYLNTSEVTTMNGMFSGCSRITNLDLSHFNTSKVTDMTAMFISCINLKEINLLSFDTSNVASMGLMFSRCQSLETLNLGSFNTKNVTDMPMMFLGCEQLKTICVGENWSVDNVVNGCWAMFGYCYNLEGEKGTECDGLWRNDKQFAHIDSGEEDHGYLSSLKYYDLWIDGEQVTTLNKHNIGGGSFSYDPSANKLTINKSYSSSRSNDIINNAISGLTIYIPTDVTLSSSEEISIIKTSQPLWVTGPGYLTCTCPELGCGIDVSEGSTLRITNANLVIQCGYGLSGYFNNSTDESLVVANSNVQINSSECAIGLFKGGISLQDCKITTPTDWKVDANGCIRTDYGYAKEVIITKTSSITTDIDNGLRDSVKGQRDGWYTIDGRKLNGMPAKKGIYIHNGKKAVVH